MHRSFGYFVAQNVVSEGYFKTQFRPCLLYKSKPMNRNQWPRSDLTHALIS